MSQLVRTRFAPSPTGFIHLGNIRSALYPWAFAKANQGYFILRIEDTDEERSTQEAVDVIMDSMRFMGMDYDEGPIHQMQRMSRYKEVLLQLKERDLIYPCYMSMQELDLLRERQMANKEKPRYDGTWRPEDGKILPAPPAGVNPCWRFKNPKEGKVIWDDKVKGRIEISNEELDDLVIARPMNEGQGTDKIGTPTYNFCVVVDDIDMAITHVIRGDDHVNNTPRQINIFRALGKEPPTFAHLPTVLNEQGEKLSKRHGAKPVTQYAKEGFLADAMVNYLARLGWSHGDDEIFTREQFLTWFDLDHLGRSAAQFDEVKLRWVNAQHIKMLDGELLAQLLVQFSSEVKVSHQGNLAAICSLLKDRCETLVDLANWVIRFYEEMPIETPQLQEFFKVEGVREAIAYLQEKFKVCDWEKNEISIVFKEVLKKFQLKMPQLAMPVRLLVFGTVHTPSIDAVLELCGRQCVVRRLEQERFSSI